MFIRISAANESFRAQVLDFIQSVNATEEAYGYFAGCMVYSVNGNGFSYAYESNDGYTHHTRNEYMTRKCPGYEYSIQ